ncbi:MAG: tail fiber domain-containing protein, partial [Candidatus Kapaibacterium sp.]
MKTILISLAIIILASPLYSQNMDYIDELKQVINIDTASHAIAMGHNVTAYGEDAVCMGYASEAIGPYTYAHGIAAKVQGNFGNSMALGNYVSTNRNHAFAFGNFVGTSTYEGSMIFGDYSVTDPGSKAYSTAKNQVTFRFYSDSYNPLNGAVRFITGKDQNSNDVGVLLYPEATQWEVLSDRNRKDSIRHVDLDKMYAFFDTVGIYTFKLKGGTVDRTMMGMMAQDFWNTFHLGLDSCSYGTADGIGAAMGGIKAVIHRFKDLKQENEELKQRIEDIE